MQKNTEQNQTKDSFALRLLAIVGSLVVIALVVWLAVQAVRILPDIFTSLSSMAERVSGGGQHDDALAVSADRTTIASGDSFMLALANGRHDGTYRFRYDCAEGVSASVRAGGTNVVEYIDCDTVFPFDANATTLTVRMYSERHATTTVPYTLTFTKTDAATGAEDFDEYREVVTVTNAAIATDATDAEAATEVSVDTDADIDTVAAEETVEVAQVPTPAPTPEPVTRTVYISYLPVSIEGGYTDLSVTSATTGYVRGDTFYPSTELDTDDTTALRVAMKNLGTKTSRDWTLSVTLPGGEDYELANRDGLLPNEEAVVTIEFDAKDESGSERFGGVVSVSGDSNRTNNSFGGVVRLHD